MLFPRYVISSVQTCTFTLLLCTCNTNLISGRDCWIWVDELLWVCVCMHDKSQKPWLLATNEEWIDWNSLKFLGKGTSRSKPFVESCLNWCRSQLFSWHACLLAWHVHAQLHHSSLQVYHALWNLLMDESKNLSLKELASVKHMKKKLHQWTTWRKKNWNPAFSTPNSGIREVNDKCWQKSSAIYIPLSNMHLGFWYIKSELRWQHSDMHFGTYMVVIWG